MYPVEILSTCVAVELYLFISLTDIRYLISSTCTLTLIHVSAKYSYSVGGDHAFKT